jgi:hypothetical protein
MNRLAQRLQTLIANVHPALRSIPDAGRKYREGWSAKEEIGHLIDSAANNHLRFVGGALQTEFQGPSYAQAEWVNLHGYQELPWADLLEFWRRYNELLVRVIARIPEDRLHTPCAIGDSPAVPLEAVIDSYIEHLQHHVDHILWGGLLVSDPASGSRALVSSR